MNYVWARGAMALAMVVAFMAPPILASWLVLLAREGQLANRRENVRGLRLLLGREGFITKVLRHMPEYLKEGFHPSWQQTQALEDTWRERLFGASGELLDEFRNRAAVTAH